jgi:hypothetical protein
MRIVTSAGTLTPQARLSLSAITKVKYQATTVRAAFNSATVVVISNVSNCFKA